MEKPRKYAEQYEKFIGEEHKCRCGCGTVLIPTYYEFHKAMVRRNVPPKYAKDHYRNVGEKRRSTEQGKYGKVVS